MAGMAEEGESSTASGNLARDPSFFLAECQLAFANDQLYFIGNDHTPAR